METNETGFWNQRKARLKEEFPIICDADLVFRDGKEKEMMEMLGFKLGKTKEELVNILCTLG